MKKNMNPGDPLNALHERFNFKRLLTFLIISYILGVIVYHGNV